MNEEMASIRKKGIMAERNQYRPEATRILDEAYNFFKENYNETVFEKKMGSVSQDFMYALWYIAKEPKYKFKVIWQSTFFGGYKLVIYVDEDACVMID